MLSSATSTARINQHSGKGGRTPWNRPCRSRPSSPPRPPPKPPPVRFFAGFTSSLAFRYSVTFIARLTKFQTTLPLLGLFLFLGLFFRDCGCGKAISFDDLFRRDGPSR